ncbi:hypothetical protein UlMin_027978 [Ulmus minor]
MNQQVVQSIQEAEKMLVEDNYTGAREKFLNLQKLHPLVEKIGSMVIICEVLFAASIKLSGYGIDYYWVLQVSPSATFACVKFRYLKLIAALQPLKNKFPGTELALRIVEDAFAVLSDCEKRSAYDLERNACREGYEILDFSVQEEMLTNGTDETMSKDSVFSVPRTKGNLVDSSFCSLESVGQKISYQDYYNFEDDRISVEVEAGQIWAAHYSRSLQMQGNYRYARVCLNSEEETVCVTWLKPNPVAADERRWCDAGLPVACGSFELDLDSTCEVAWSTISSYKCSWDCGVAEDQFEIYPRRGELWALYRNWNIDEWASSRDSVKLCTFEIVEMISDFSKYTGADCVCLEKVDGFNYIFKRKAIGGSPVTFHVTPSQLYMFSHKVPAYKFLGGEIDGVVDGMFELDHLALPDHMINEISIQKTPDMDEVSSSPSISSTIPSSCNSCPEDDILKPKWSISNFSKGQIWAVYYGEDLMPRLYTRIDSIISESQVFVTLLEPLPILDCEINWKKENLPIVCGLFKVSKTGVLLELSQFAYLAHFHQSTETLYKIEPLKGEIWAIYKNWNNKWKQSDHEFYECKIVQILSDCKEGDGIRIARLEEVKGYVTFFQKKQYDGFDLTCEVLKTQMLSFSHRIPAFKVPGIGSYGIPESSWHVEPNALPPKRDQFQVRTLVL